MYVWDRVVSSWVVDKIRYTRVFLRQKKTGTICRCFHVWEDPVTSGSTSKNVFLALRIAYGPSDTPSSFMIE